MVVRWKFFDPVDSTTTAFEVNPNEGGSLLLEKPIVARSTVAQGGVTILFEGNKPVQQIVFSGILYSETALNVMVDMFAKRHQIRLTDDLGRQFMIFIDKFEPKRVRARHSPWKHTYTITATIVDWP